MPVQITPTVKSEGASIDRVMSFYDTGDPMFFYQNAKVPMTMLLMSIHPDDPDSNVFSLLAPDELFNCAVNRSIKGRDTNSLHSSNYFDLKCVLRGYMHQNVEGRRYFYGAGSCCLINCGTRHSEIYTSDFDCLCLTLGVDLVESLTGYGHPPLFSSDAQDNEIMRFLKRNVREHHTVNRDFLDFVPIIDEAEQKKRVHPVFEEMAGLFLKPESGASFKVQALLLRLFDILCNPGFYNIVHVHPRTNADPLLFARVNQLLEKHKGRIGNAELSSLLNYNGTYIGRIVKKNTGKTLSDYAMDFTMRAATGLLADSKLSVAKIAETLQFSNRTHFYNKFRQYYGMTPARYRELARGVGSQTSEGSELIQRR